MEEISLTDAKANLGELIDRVQAGATFDITRRGRPVARLAAVSIRRKRIDAVALEALTTLMTPQAQSAGNVVHDMRDSERS